MISGSWTLFHDLFIIPGPFIVPLSINSPYTASLQQEETSHAISFRTMGRGEIPLPDTVPFGMHL